MTDKALPRGVHIISPGDPQFCWNPYRHYPHLHRYVRYDPDGTEVTGQVDCDGDGEWIRIAMIAHFTEHGSVPCPTCEGGGNLGGDRGDGQPYPCAVHPRTRPGTPVCNGTGRWSGQTAP